MGEGVGVSVVGVGRPALARLASSCCPLRRTHHDHRRPSAASSQQPAAPRPATPSFEAPANSPPTRCRAASRTLYGDRRRTRARGGGRRSLVSEPAATAVEMWPPAPVASLVAQQQAVPGQAVAWSRSDLALDPPSPPNDSPAFPACYCWCCRRSSRAPEAVAPRPLSEGVPCFRLVAVRGAWKKKKEHGLRPCALPRDGVRLCARPVALAIGGAPSANCQSGPLDDVRPLLLAAAAVAAAAAAAAAAACSAPCLPACLPAVCCCSMRRSRPPPLAAGRGRKTKQNSRTFK